MRPQPRRDWVRERSRATRHNHPPPSARYSIRAADAYWLTSSVWAALLLLLLLLLISSGTLPLASAAARGDEPVPVVLLSTLEAAAAEGGVAGAGGGGTAGSILLHVARRVETLAAVPAPAPAALPDHCPPDHGSLVRVGSWGGGALEGGPAIGAVDHDDDDDDDDDDDMQPG
eukprot:COSAG01_NODE_24326_length_783_cov_0.853801_1_plen_172_part_01